MNKDVEFEDWPETTKKEHEDFNFDFDFDFEERETKKEQPIEFFWDDELMEEKRSNTVVQEEFRHVERRMPTSEDIYSYKFKKYDTYGRISSSHHRKLRYKNAGKHTEKYIRRLRNKEENKLNKHERISIFSFKHRKGKHLAKSNNSWKRKIKDASDSIRNKIYSYKKERNTRIIRKAIGAVSLSLIILAGVKAQGNARFNAENDSMGNDYNIEQSIETLNNSNVDSFNIETEPIVKLSERRNQDESKEYSSVRSIRNEKVKKEENEIEEENNYEAENDRVSYLDSVRVGCRMNIESGKYFETSSGTGNYGYFENYKGIVKIISMIAICTEEGKVETVTDSSVSLRELKEKYPNAEFSYHLTDENGNAMGWLTSDSFEQNIQNETIEEDLER